MVSVRLRTPGELFSVGSPDLFDEAVRLRPGIEELETGPLWHKLPHRVGIDIHLPAEQIGPDTAADLEGALKRYCGLRLEEMEQRLRIMRRDGLGALGVGLVIFGAGLYLSYLLSQRRLPEAIRVVFGDGVFLVIAWVGLWYPLDTLVFTPRSLLRERKLLRLLAEADLRLVPETAISSRQAG
jgi:hypothetical protein